jgi:hypothetical protein
MLQHNWCNTGGVDLVILWRPDWRFLIQAIVDRFLEMMR